MSRAEIQALSDEDLLKAWAEIKAVFQMNTQQYFDKKTGLIFFANFVNVSSELHKRKIPT